MSNIITLHKELKSKTYKHSPYEAFNISDPKPRNIHKAKVKDRLLHHAIYRRLYSFLDKTFISDSYSCRLNKGIHKAINRFRYLTNKISKNNTKTIWILQCDIKKFFDSVGHKILTSILQEYIEDTDILWLFNCVIDSFHKYPGKGLPLGNLTSQLLVNVYMNKFDQFVKHKLKAKYYIRYADDFVIISQYKEWLQSILPEISIFLLNKLKLQLHPNKISIRTLSSGIDFLGWVHFPDHRVLRTTTKRRMFKRIKEMNRKEEIIQSYLGLISHGNAIKLQRKIERLSDEGTVR